ncbi:hypothetical protein WKU26_07935 [Phocaeicola sp. HCN-40430]|uniref:hypothetical protein n=1 Tax=Phocaeicola sp. HCN-40430 TaxID=3134664 RepID=UPI0030C03CE9
MVKKNLFIIISFPLLSVLWNGCTQEYLPEEEDFEGITVQFGLNEGLSGLDNDTELIPMSRNGKSAFNNFILKNSELRIYRKIENSYIIQQLDYQNYPDYPEPISINDTHKFSLSDFGLKDSYVLQPGEYRACILLNGPYYLFSPNLIGKSVPVISGPDKYIGTNSMREAYFSFVDFEVKKGSQLDGNVASRSPITFPTLSRKAIPVRIILKSNIENSTIKEFQLGCKVISNHTIPYALDTDGSYIYEDTAGEMNITRMSYLYKDKASESNLFFPYYGDSNKDHLTSFFVLLPDKDVPVNLNIEIYSLSTEGVSLDIDPINVIIKDDKCMTIVLELDQQQKLLNATEYLLEQVKTDWNRNHSEVPFDYLEYNLIQNS